MLEQIEIEILNELNAFSIEYFARSNNSDITFQIKERICKIGSKRDFSVCVSGFPELYNSEWLYDIVFFKEDKSKTLLDVELVLECELSYDLNQIKYDFEKLLISNTKHKLFICCAGKFGVMNTINYLQKIISNYNFKENYRFVVYIWDDYGVGDFKVHIYEN